MPGSRRARTGRGWDAAPPRPRSGDEPTRSAPTAARRWGRGPAAEDAPVDPAERAREICLRLLAVRPRTRQELAAALRQRGIAEDVAAEVLQRYGEVGMVDDRAFARAWVASRHHGKGLAGRALAGELRRKGVEPDAIGEALGELDGDTEARTARELVDRKLRAGRGDQPEATMRRLVGMLARKGYPPGLAFRVVKEAMAEAADDGKADLSGTLQAEEFEAALESAALDAAADPEDVDP